MQNMRKTFRMVMLSIMLGVLALSCSQPEESPSTTRTLIQAGESTRSFSALSFASVSDSSDSGGGGSLRSATVCNFSRNIGSLVILETVGEPKVIVPFNDCSGPYSQTAFIHSAKVWAVAAGEALPDHIEFVRVGPDSSLEPGELILVTLRNIDDEWFASASVRLEEVTDQVADEDNTQSTLPNTFEEISRQAMSAHANLEGVCPEAFRSRKDDNSYRAFVKDPLSRGCNPASGTAGDSLNNEEDPNCVGDDAPVCCFDDSIDCP